jgi:MutS domain V
MTQEIPTPLEVYRRRTREAESSAEEMNSRCGSWQAGALALALLACVFLYESLVVKKLPVWTSVFPIAAAAVVAKQAQQHRRRVLRLLSVGEYYDKGVARLKRDWELLDDGKDFIDPDHIYAADLDLFGRGSLFQLLCSARTHVGRETLATWMKSLACRDEVQGRREAISELRERRDLFESVAAAGTSTVSDCRPGTFRSWVAEMSSRPRFPSWAPPVAFMLALVLAVLPVLYLTGHLGLQNLWVSLGAVLGVEAVFAGIFSEEVRTVLESVRLPSAELPIVCELLQIVEREQFSSARLRELAKRLKGDNSTASGSVRRLNRLVRLLGERDNAWFTALSWCLLWGTQFSMAIDRWHRRHGADLLKWLSAIGEFEALLSLGAYACEHPRDVFPEITEGGPSFEAEGLGHPLLDESICVPNDVHLGDGARFLIVSGSNMSGKSTFLRAIGMNAVLAWMGAPVRCARLRLSKLEIAASIGVQDSLTDGRSHFLAEMQRVRRMIDRASEGPLLFLADEIMSGTNSRDRRIAAEWVIRALVLRNAIGLITTHDLTLTEIATNGLAGRNVHFEDSGEGGELHFDYKLRSGLLNHSNALNIVRMLGIDTET